jgi:hypothetical protein
VAGSTSTSTRRRVRLTLEVYEDLKVRVARAGYADDYAWAETVTTPVDAVAFFREYAYVVCNSGMRATVARGIWERVCPAIDLNLPVSVAYGHPGKATAIQTGWDERERIFAEYLAASDKLAFFKALPWIGEITKHHLAKNTGISVSKPDRWLVRLAEAERTTPEELCERLAAASGDRVGTVDVVLWRACSLGMCSRILRGS